MANVSPMGQTNAVAVVLRGSDLGLVEADFTMADGAAIKTLDPVQTPSPMNVEVLIALSAGQLDLAYDLNATGVFGVADATRTIVAADGEVAVTFQTTSALPYANIKWLPDAGGATVSKFKVNAVGVKPEGSGWIDVNSGLNALGEAGGAHTYGATD